MSDEKILKATAEIEAVALKYDLGMYLNLEDRGRSEFRVRLPSWSIAKLTPDKKGVTLQFRKANWADSEYTVGMLLSMRDRAKTQYEACEILCEAITAKMEVSSLETDLLKKETLQ